MLNNNKCETVNAERFFNVVTTDPKNESSKIGNYFCDILLTDKYHR